jgi:hypothetical protein
LVAENPTLTCGRTPLSSLKKLHAEGLSNRKIAAKLAESGHVTGTKASKRTGGRPYVASAIQKMLGRYTHHPIPAVCSLSVWNQTGRGARSVARKFHPQHFKTFPRRLIIFAWVRYVSGAARNASPHAADRRRRGRVMSLQR